jgi:cytidylate kinase
MSAIVQIAIDGHSSTGKSTIAKQIAKEFNITYIDTGAMYRCITLFAIRNHLIESGEVKEEELIKHLPNITIKLDQELVFLNGENVSDEIRNMEVSNNVSFISQIKEVRSFLVSQQQDMGKTQSVVMDGRDIGSVVFPESPLKLFITANPKVRANRRHKELLDKNQNVSFDEVLRNLTERDRIDSTRKESPLIECDDAVKIDNSNLSNQEQMSMLYALIRSRLSFC